MDTPRRGAVLVLFSLVCALVGLAAQTRAEPPPLALEAQVNGAWVRVLGVDQKRLHGQGPAGDCPIPATAPLRLVGDLAAHPELIETAVSYELAEVPPPTDSTHPTGWVAQNIHPSAEFVAGPKARWHPVHPEKAVLVCLWQIAGQPTQLRALPLQGYPENGFKSPWISLELTATEAPGNPVLLLLEDGQPASRVVAPADADYDRLGALVTLGKDGDVAAELRSAGRLPSAPKGAPSLLHLAAQSGANQTVDALLQLGAAPKAKTDAGDTPLHLAARNGRTASVAAFIAAKAPLDAANAKADTPLHLAAAGAHAEACRLLIEAGAPVNATNEYLQTPAFRALLADCTPAVELLLAHKGEFGCNDSVRDRLLVRKAASGQRRLVQILLSRRADPNAVWFGQTALFAASREGYEGVVAELLGAKADPNQPGAKAGTTPLLAAAGRGRVAVVRQLLTAGAKATAATKNGYTAMHAACFTGSAPTVQALLAAGASPDSATAQGVTPLTFALGSGSRETVEALLAAGAKADRNNPRFDGELSAALAMDSDAFVAAVLKAGMPVDQQTAKGWSALQLATIGKADRCAALLRAAGATDNAQASVLVPNSQLDKRPALLELNPTIDPRDPEEADFVATTVVVEAIVGTDGTPAFARATCEDCRLSLSAVQTVLRSRFQPALKGGAPVATQVRIPVAFTARAERTFDFSSLDVKPQVISRVAPRYPSQLKRQGITGQAVVEFVVAEDGSIQDIVVVDATHDAFGESAIAAVRGWRFKPGILDGKTVRCRIRQSFPFVLS